MAFIEIYPKNSFTSMAVKCVDQGIVPYQRCRIGSCVWKLDKLNASFNFVSLSDGVFGRIRKSTPVSSSRDNSTKLQAKDVVISAVEKKPESASVLLHESSPGFSHYSQNEEKVSILSTLGISRPQTLAILRRQPEILGLDSRVMQDAISFYISLGCSMFDIANAISKNYSWLTASVEDLSSLVEFLVANRVHRNKVPTTLFRCAFLLSSRPGVLEGPSRSLQSILGEEARVSRILESKPRVLALNGEDIRQSFGTMNKFIPEGQIPSIIMRSPYALLLSPAELSSRFQVLATIFHPHRLPMALHVAPAIINLDATSLQQRFSNLENYLTPTAATRLVNAFPQSLTLDWEKIVLPKFTYLDTIGLDRFEVTKFPAFLGYSLQSRIHPRTEALLKAGYKIRPHREVIPYFREKKLHINRLTHYQALQLFGFHKVCIQHYVGLRDEAFEERFGLGQILSSENLDSR